MQGLNRNLTPFKHACSVYERMLEIAEDHKRVRYGQLGFETNDEPDPEFFLDPADPESGKAVPFFSGSLSSVVRDVTDNRGQYSVIREILTMLRCVQPTMGSTGRGSEFYMLRHPVETEGGEAPHNYSTNRAGSRYADTRQGQLMTDVGILRGAVAELQFGVRSLGNALTEMHTWYNNMEVRIDILRRSLENAGIPIWDPEEPDAGQGLSAHDLVEGGEDDGQEIHAEEGAETESGT